MPTPAQITALKNAINAATDPTVVALRGQAAEIVAGHVSGQPIADYFNADGTTDLWRVAVGVDELKNAVDWSTATGFAGRDIPQRDVWFALTQGGQIDPRITSIRLGFVEAFGAGSTSLTALTTLALEKASRFQEIFKTANGTAFVLTDESLRGYDVTESDVRNALV